MKKVQVLQNLAAKFVLDMPRHSSATEALHQLGWDNLTERRRLHRLILFFKALNGLIDWDFNLYSFKDIHNYNTRGRNDICRPKSCRSWGQNRFINQAAQEWNILPDKAKSTFDILTFKRLIRSI